MIYVSFVSLFIVSVCMLRFAYTDFKFSIIENFDLLIFLIFTILFNITSNWFIYDTITIISILASISYWMFSFFYKDGNLFGGGDLKMLIIMTFLFPPFIYWQIIFLGFIFSLLYFIPWLILKRSFTEVRIPSGVPLAIPIAISYYLVISKLLINLYL